jgi:creatinine amidohydrolase
VSERRRTRRLAELRAPEIVDAVGPGATLVLPVGAVEQHGPHLPLATDLLIADAVCDQLVAARGDELDLWLLPPLAVSRSNEHAWAPGTLWLGPTTLLAVLDDLGRSLARLPARRLLFVNGHGGNSALLAVACRELRLAHGLLTFLAHPFVPPDQGGAPPPDLDGDGELGCGIHAGLDETSMVLALRPDLVDLGAARRAVPEALAANRHVRFGGPVTFGWTSQDLGLDGVIGDPTGATAARGTTLLALAVAALGAACEEIARFELGHAGLASTTEHTSPTGD